MNKNNYKPLYEDRADETLRDLSMSDFLHYKELYGEGGYSLDIYRKTTEFKLSRKETVNKILKFIKNNNISDNDMKIFNKILGDHQVLDKLVFINDGSFRNNRLYYNGGFIIECRKEYYCSSSPNVYRNKWTSPNKFINNIKNNYEVIFIHLNPDKDIYNPVEEFDYTDYNPIINMVHPMHKSKNDGWKLQWRQ